MGRVPVSNCFSIASCGHVPNGNPGTVLHVDTAVPVGHRYGAYSDVCHGVALNANTGRVGRPATVDCMPESIKDDVVRSDGDTAVGEASASPDVTSESILPRFRDCRTARDVRVLGTAGVPVWRPDKPISDKEDASSDDAERDDEKEY